MTHFRPKDDNSSFIKTFRSNESEQLMRYPSCLILLLQISLRAKRTNSLDLNGLEIGEALIGDHDSIGLTQQQYRTAKRNLKKWGFITTKSTNKGTIAKLINTDVFDINIELDNDQTNERIAHQKLSNNNQITTNNKNKNEKKEKNVKNHVSDAFLKLTQRGIEEPVAKDLTARNSEEFIEMKILQFDYLESNKPERISFNPPGYLVKSINEDYTPPAGFDEWYDNYKVHIGHSQSPEILEELGLDINKNKV